MLTINGGPQRDPEGVGRLPRRYRLFVECARRLAADPLTAQASAGRPVGDGHGLEELVAKIAPLFDQEPSLVKWVALRGAFTELFIRVFDRESAVATPLDLEAAMGLEWVAGADGASHPDLVQPWRADCTAEQRQAALGVASGVLVRVSDYVRYSRMTVPAVNLDSQCQIPRLAALDYIAWSAVALLRLGLVNQMFAQVPEPDALSSPGWYPEPLFAKAERYWNGSDWLASCRALQDGRYVEANVPLS